MSAPTKTGLGQGQEQEPLQVPEKVMAVLNGIPGLVAYWDRDLRNHVANQAYVEYFGLTPDQVRGSHMREVLGEEVYAANEPFITAALAGEEQFFDRAIVDVSGQTRHNQVSYIPDRRDGVVHGFFVLVTEVTERVLAERSLSKSIDQYRALARSMPTGFVLVFDRDLRFVIADGVELATFGFTRASLEGRRMQDAFPAALGEELEPRYRAALAGEPTSWERQIGRRTFKLSAGPVRSDNGDVVSGMVTATDITTERVGERTWAALHAIATEVARQGNPEEVAASIASALVETFGVDNAAIIRFTGPTSGEILAMAPAMVPGLSTNLEWQSDEESAMSQVLTTGLPALVRYSTATGPFAEQMAARGLLVGLAAPVRHHGSLWGAIGLLSASDQGLDGLLGQLTWFAELLELAVGTTTAWDTLSREAATDALTGLANRRAFDVSLRQEVDQALRHRGPLSVAVLDVDHFKSVNDRFGHPVGDRVLAELGRRLSSISRDHEMIARLGGEEFGWVLTGADATAADLAAERLRAHVADTPFEEIGRLTISIGVATLGDLLGHASGRELMAAADRALYEAKKAGRDRVSHQCA